MKRIVLITVASLALAGAAIAQPFGGMMGRGMGPGYGYGPGAAQNAPTAKSIEGKLVFIDQVPAIQAKDATYLIRMPGFFRSAYFDGIKEGAIVKADGYLLGSIPGQANPYFMVTKAVIGGKTYDFTTGQFGPGGFGHGGMMGGFGMMGRGRW